MSCLIYAFGVLALTAVILFQPHCTDTKPRVTQVHRLHAMGVASNTPEEELYDSVKGWRPNVCAKTCNAEKTSQVATSRTTHDRPLATGPSRHSWPHVVHSKRIHSDTRQWFQCDSIPLTPTVLSQVSAGHSRAPFQNLGPSHKGSSQSAGPVNRIYPSPALLSRDIGGSISKTGVHESRDILSRHLEKLMIYTILTCVVIPIIWRDALVLTATLY